MSETRTVGQPLPRIDAGEKVRGEAVFTSDIQSPRMLVGRFLPSPHAHAEILSIDTSRAEALPGVHAVVIGADIPKVNTFEPNSPYHAFMARRFAVYAGQPIAAVAADSRAIADAALDLIQVNYRLLPVVHSVQQGMLPDCPAVSREPDPIERETEPSADNSGEKESPNIAYRFVLEHGDLDAAFAESDVIVEGTYTVPVVHQGYIEPHTVLAHWDRLGHVTVWECVQSPFEARDLIAETLGIPHTNISLHATEVGGAFGGKWKGIFGPLTVLLAKKTKHPVRLALTRRQELTGANPAPRSVVWLKTGAKSDGTLTALKARVLLDPGAFPSEIHLGIGISAMLRTRYRFQAWHLESMEVLTNKVAAGSYRAPGAVNAAFPIESQMDEMANRLGLDPLVLRLQNVVQEGDPSIRLEPEAKNGAKEVLAALAEHPSWTDPLPARQSDDGLLRGRGTGIGRWGSSMWAAAAVAALEANGKMRVVLGTSDISGSYTSLAQIAAEAIGVSTERIVVNKAGTDHALFAPVSGGSGTIYSMGLAVRAAAQELRSNILERAATELDAAEEELRINDEGVFVCGQPERFRSFPTLYRLGTHWQLAKYPPLVGKGATLPQEPTPTFAASVAEVAVDQETGRVMLTRLVTAQDVGKAINPLSVEGQIQGAAAQSVGMALWEEVLYDDEGQVLNPNLLDYRMATAADMPPVEPIIVEVPSGDGPYGAKGVGEPPMISPVTAVTNAIAAAIGTRIYDLPITPERIWRALEAQKNEGEGQKIE